MDSALRIFPKIMECANEAWILEKKIKPIQPNYLPFWYDQITCARIKQKFIKHSMVESLLVKVLCAAPGHLLYSYNWKILQLPKPQRCTYRSLIHDDEVQVISNRTKPEAVIATFVSSSQGQGVASVDGVITLQF